MEVLTLMLLLMAQCLTLVASEQQLLGVTVLTRHGNRDRLYKNTTTLEESREAGLTFTGQQELFNQGSFLREKYITTGLLADDTAYTYARSSEFERTILSANSFLLGLYPPITTPEPNTTTVVPPLFGIRMVPTYVVTKANDYVLRGWDGCDRFVEGIEEWHESAEFKEYSFQAQPLIDSITEKLGIPSTNLENVYNVYDIVNNLEDTNNSAANALNSSDIENLEQIASWAEISKFSLDAGSTAGSFLYLFDVLKWAKEFDINATSKIRYFSGHYPQFLSIFHSLGLLDALETIPEYGSAIVLELYGDTLNQTPNPDSNKNSEFYLKFLYRNGTNGEFAQLSLQDCLSISNSEECTVESFETLLTYLVAAYPDIKKYLNFNPPAPAPASRSDPTAFDYDDDFYDRYGFSNSFDDVNSQKNFVAEMEIWCGICKSSSSLYTSRCVTLEAMDAIANAEDAGSSGLGTLVIIAIVVCSLVLASCLGALAMFTYKGMKDTRNMSYETSNPNPTLTPSASMADDLTQGRMGIYNSNSFNSTPQDIPLTAINGDDDVINQYTQMNDL